MLRMGRVAEHSFLANRVAGATVVDLGMNEGSFAVEMRDRYGAQVVGVEPVPALYERLVALDGIAVQQVAIGQATGELLLYLNDRVCATVMTRLRQDDAPHIRVPSLTLADFLAQRQLTSVELLKMDVEGAELGILMTTPEGTLARISQITVEFHAFLDPVQKPAVAAVTERLKTLGFAHIDFSLSRATDVLFVNTRRVPFPGWQRALLVALFKYPAGLGRLARRFSQIGY